VLLHRVRTTHAGSGARSHRARARQPGPRDGRARRSRARRVRERSRRAAKGLPGADRSRRHHAHDEHAVRALHHTARRAPAASTDAAKTVELLSTLNPERVFRIHVPLDQVARRWQPILAGLDAGAPPGRKLDAANAALPGRVNLTALPVDAMLARAAEAAKQAGPDAPTLRAQPGAFIEKAPGGR